MRLLLAFIVWYGELPTDLLDEEAIWVMQYLARVTDKVGDGTSFGGDGGWRD